MEAHERIIELLESIDARLRNIEHPYFQVRIDKETGEAWTELQRESTVPLSRVRELRDYCHEFGARSIALRIVIERLDKLFPELKASP